MNTITKGHQIGTGSELLKNTLTLNQPLAGVGGTTWVFEIANSELIILTFYWPVKPNVLPELNNKYNLTTNGAVNSNINVKVDYKVNRSFALNINESWTQLIGVINQNIKINIKKKYPFYSTIKNPELIQLFKKYHIVLNTP